jgi:ABC-type antimicrobial peptide transport system permease subunit
VSLRRSEIGIRIALGAQPLDVMRLVLMEGLSMIGSGAAIGLGGAFIMARVLSGHLHGVSATDPFIFLGVSSLLAAVALVACLIPARRAARLDPLVALRYE